MSGLLSSFFEKLKKLLGKLIKSRVFITGLVLFLLFFVLIVRIFDLQIIKGGDYYDKYVNTTKKEVTVPAMRGNIYDRNGVLLAGNRVVYSVTISDENFYSKGNGDFNEMLLRLIRLLEKYDVPIVETIPVRVNDADEYEFSGSESRIKLLIRDVYGQKKIQELAEDGKDAYSYSAETVMQAMKAIYNFTSRWAGGSSVSKADALKICNIRYQMAATTYTRYITTAVARDVSEQVRNAVMENGADLMGVAVEETYEREYYNSECFSSILGYVGSITTEEIEELNAAGGNYSAGDVIGKQGIESAYESYLQGIKGKKQIYVNSTGMILAEEMLEEPQQGNDVYLSIDANMSIAAYNIMEQQLAGVVVNHLYKNTDYDPEIAYENSDYKIPIRDVYFQMINNNILSMREFASANALPNEKRMEEKKNARKRELIGQLSEYLRGKSSEKLSDSSKYYQAYLRYFHTYLNSEGYISKNSVDTSDEIYLKWQEGECSFPDFLLYALKSGWINTSKLEDETRYQTVDACYEYLVSVLVMSIEQSFGEFDKLIYDELIHTDVISGTEVGIALIHQGVLNDSEETLQKLESGSQETAFAFFEGKIQSMELRPSQIALDPCSAGLVLTDPNNGNLLACVSYPGYDLNRINDTDYYSKLLNDQSSPLYSRATQTRLAPGSTFKMITAVAALEDGYVGEEEQLYCSGTFDKLDHPRCWIGRLANGEHGYLDMVHAIGQSCNCFFYECGYRFSLNQNNAYSPSTGVSVITKYAEMFGFGEKTGIETAENVSTITTELPVTSAIGQGTNAFTTISLARYVTAIASSGNVYEFKFLNRIENRDKEVILSYTPVVKTELNFKQSTWDIIHDGMYTVVHEGGSRRGDFSSLRYQYAAKSGSAQENRLRAEHGWYVTYGPYDNISYAMAVQIPNGYTAGNAALIAKGLYHYLEGNITLEEILRNSAANSSANNIPD